MSGVLIERIITLPVAPGDIHGADGGPVGLLADTAGVDLMEQVLLDVRAIALTEELGHSSVLVDQPAEMLLVRPFLDREERVEKFEIVHDDNL